MQEQRKLIYTLSTRIRRGAGAEKVVYMPCISEKVGCKSEKWTYTPHNLKSGVTITVHRDDVVKGKRLSQKIRYQRNMINRAF